ncbi:zinc finger homeobox protein 3-like [Gigantopelta aegis]|uniref:zinc finger homeobox protein 3-like n=1 Tax=Gigantopelta aegis TaxID=1735272 RepID=UPI001B88B28F|nr:zinc finger homeobox protein 3-like [Gigantopelta aegis]
MDVSSLNADRAGEALSSCQSTLVTTATSMGERQPLSSVDKQLLVSSSQSPLKPIIGNMVVSKNDESDQNFYNYSTSSVLSEKKGLKILANSVKEKSGAAVTNCVSPPVVDRDVCGLSDKDDVVDDDGDDDPVKCGDCDMEFATLQQYMDHPCSQSNSRTAGSADESELSEGESFDGKIVYNPDGSAYIIECDGCDLDDLDSMDVPKQEGAIIVDKKISSTAVPSSFPQINNAFFLSRNPQSFLNNYCTTPNSTKTSKHGHDAPIMHSYRVYDLRSGKSTSSSVAENHISPSTSAPVAALTVPTKPILMCFICKLSFGFSKSFVAHANTEHTMTLSKEEKAVMSQRNASAIIQCVGKEKQALMSFLEPVAITPVPRSTSSPESKKVFPYYQAKTSSTSTTFLGKESTSVSYVYSKPKISLPPVMETISHTSKSLTKNDRIDLGTGLIGHTSIKEEVKNGGNMDDATSASDAESDCSQSSKNGGSLGLPSLVSASGSTAVTNSFASQDSESLSHSKSLAITSSSSMLMSHPLSLASTLPSPSIHNPPMYPAFLRVCDEHPQGRAHGAECPKCDMILGSSQSLGGHMTMMHSRNSCKTLKCPKCNWHYKYQETLEIHMKEKHPESDQQCIYCIANQPHPRLARGETYSCGYKPYRCEVCNYSTTTKGNLSIHMQSDKHINNMQELANGGQEVKITQQETYNNSSSSSSIGGGSGGSGGAGAAVPDDVYKKIKPKQTWRCDVCNYETAVARNLRIHMTSEKHTHNMMVLQQNMKHMQRDMHLQINQLMMLGQQDPVLFGLPTQMAGAMFPYDQQMLASGMPAGFEVPVNLTTENGMSSCPVPPSLSSGGEFPDSVRLFHCCVCNSYLTDSLDALHQHLQHDRTKQRENEHIVVASGSYLCNLCTYKTNLKANFQLHCKTDKHLQRVQLVNHIKEGGAANEWRLKYLNVSNPVQVRCNACDYYTNSIHKLQMHTGSLQHESSAQLFLHLQLEEARLGAAAGADSDDDKYYQCTLCQHSSKTKLGLIQHARSVGHIQKENVSSQKNEMDKLPLEIGTVFVVKGLKDGEVVHFEEDRDRETPESAALLETPTDTAEKSLQSDLQLSNKTTASSSSSTTNTAITTSSSSNHTISNGSSSSSTTKGQAFSCLLCNYSSSSEQLIEDHVSAQHALPLVVKRLPCPLCQDEYEKKTDLEQHLVKSHNVKPEGLQRILSILDITGPASTHNHVSGAGGSGEPGSEGVEIDENTDIDLELLEIDHTKMVAEDGFDMSVLLDKSELDTQYRCQTCSKTFTNIDQLYAHQNELGHLELKQTPRGPGYLCWKKGCNQYFKTAQALQIHFREIHAKRPSISSADCSQYSHQCSQCTMAFVSADKLQMHNQYHLINSVTTCSICTQSFHSVGMLRKHYESAHPEVQASELAKHKMNLSANVAALIGSSEYRKFLITYTKSSATKSSASAASSALNRSASVELFGSADQEMQDSSMMNEDDNDLDTSCSDSPEDHVEDTGEEREGEGDRSDQPSVYREEQFMEDFINSQAMAEGSYEDPSRKFKCHRCKAAFTKQNYLTAHNKTLQHRRGDKISYPMERYLDPNRPFKCDVCKESFTQKNILLVHYNSVSHLHKLKQAAQQGTLPPTISVGPPTTCSSLQLPVSCSESEQKPYRCNICKVAYSQGSTLDIHIRSVAHQTRASKIHELAMTGQIDISQMLIEQPDISKASTQQVQALTDMISQTQAQVTVGSPLQHGSLLLGGIPGYSMLSGLQLPVATSNSLMSPSSSSAISVISETDTSKSHKTSHKKNEEHNSHSRSTAEGCSENNGFHFPVSKKEPQEDLNESVARYSEKNKLSESQLFNISKSLNSHHSESPIEKQLSNQHLPHRCGNCNSFFINEEALQIHQQIYCNFPPITTSTASKPRYICRFKPQLHRSLLQNIGFECVMQFNEYNQHIEVKKDNTEKEEGDDAAVSVEVKVEPKDDEKDKIDLPEINKSTCLSCNKDFSSVWVLKAHQEEVHKDLVPIDAVEGFSEKFREDFDKKLPLDESQTPTSSGVASMPYSNSTSSDSLVIQEMPPPPPPPPPPMQAAFDMSQLMPMFGMMPMHMPMNLMGLAMQSPLVSMMMPKGADMQSLLPPVSVMESNFTATQQQLQAAQNQKRVRTRISDDQLKILRGYFDINNSPSEEQIQQMSEQSGLPPKVIKHWFRNTLFKERQRNKDSPYNFNNPPSTSLDLEEYEKTGIIPALSPVVVKQEPKDDFEDDDDDDDNDVPSTKNDKGNESEPEREREQEQEKMESLVKLETFKVEPPDDKREFETSSNASTPSITSSITSTPTCSLPNTPTTEDLLRHEFSSGSMSKRANRTRFTDYQIKMLQDYFDQNAYPKDDELDHLSKMLNLSPRVIVVWFQNARQKVRKVYENQPAAETKDDTSSYQRTPGLNYQCKKCQAVFQRYYELIKHQKRPCLPENNNTTTQSLMSNKTDDDSNSTSMSQDDLSQSGSFTDFQMSDAKGSSPNSAKHIPTFNCDKCEASYNRLDLWQEHQKVHSLNPSLFPSFSSSSAFGMLQTLAQQEDSKIAAAAAKRKIDSEDDQDDQPRDKRLRTTILPEQLDYLYQKYQQDCNPSRKQLESISSDVGLKKRVVQVWFQNTRARERKGQYRAHQQLIHKRCPFCRALFRAKSAMESHLATKHPDEMAKNEINVDAIPDAVMDGSNPTSPQPHSATPSGSGHPGDFSKLLSPSIQQYLPFLPSPSNLGLSFSPDPLQLSMKQIYEDSFKKYITELSGTAPPPAVVPVPPQSRHNSESSRRTETESVVEEEAPLDLSKPVKVSTDVDKSSDGPSTDLSERSGDDLLHNRRVSVDDSFSETQSENLDMDECDDSMSSPTSPTNMSQGHGHGHHQNKRYRTQMTSKQVKIMKLLFVDYKTPTMVECEMLGSEIGLQKRVVQVWFQNARAKEKKSKLVYTKTFGTDVDFNKPPEECTFCSFKYSHKFTVQDHIFTKKHISNVKAFIQSQAEAEREMSDPTGMSTLLRQQRDLEHSRKTWPDLTSSSSATPHLSQLQALGMNAMGVADTVGIGRSLNLGTGHAGSDTSTPKRTHDTRKEETESRKKEAKVEASSSSKQHEQAQAMVSAEMAMNAQMMALGGYLPGMDPSFLQYMYPGLPGYFPGMGLPMMQPGLFPGIGAEHMMAYDPLSFGTPLPLLQIPQQAIKLVSEQLEDPRSSLAQYTQDCKSLSDLKALVSTLDYSCAHETMVDVGYICKKCQTVYPAKEACVNHQRMVCFPGGKIHDNVKAMLKLEQIQYGCRACSDKFSTLYEFKIHCQMDAHKMKVGKVQHGSGGTKSRSEHNSGAAGLLLASSAATVTNSSSCSPSRKPSSSLDVSNKHGHGAHSKPKTE